MKVGNKVRPKNNLIISENRGRVLSTSECYRVERIKEDKILLSYDDGFVPKELRSIWFDSVNFTVLPNEHKYNVGDKLILNCPGRVVQRYLTSRTNPLEKFQGRSFVVTEQHLYMTDWIRIKLDTHLSDIDDEESDDILPPILRNRMDNLDTIRKSSAQYWVYCDAMKLKVSRSLPDWF